MSREASPNSQSESSGSSPNQVYFLKDYTEYTLLGNSVPQHLRRSSTVRRASASSKKERESSIDDCDINRFDKPEPQTERYRRSLDSTYRRSLESISEYKTKSSFSSCSLHYNSRDCSTSIESPSSDCNDYAIIGGADSHKETDKTFSTVSSNYLSWIESVNSDYGGTATTDNANDIVDIDTKVGEWNNFWLNYNSPQNRYLSSPYLCASNEERTVDDVSECKSTCSTQKISTEQIMLGIDEIMEAIQCSQRVTEILQKALKRSDEIDQSRNDSYYSQRTVSFHHQHSLQRNNNYNNNATTLFDDLQNSVTEDLRRDKYMIDNSQDYQRQKQQQQQQQNFKTVLPSGNSCINVLLNTGVADILKRVINKRREVIAPEEITTSARSSFSNWSSTK